MDPVKVFAFDRDHQVAVAADADERKGLKQVIGAEVLAGSKKLFLVGEPLHGIEPLPSRIDAEKCVFDEVAHWWK